MNFFLRSTARLGLSSRRSTGRPGFRRPTTIRALQLINGEHYAGAERVQDNLALQLPVEGVETAFVCVKPNQFESKRASRETPLLNLPMRNRLDVRPAFRLAKLVEREDFDLIHTHTPRTAMIGSLAARIAGVPFVHHVHGHTATEVNAGWKQRLATKVENRSLNRANYVIAVSPTVAQYLRSHGIAEQKVTVIPNGISGPGELPLKTPPSANQTWTLGIVGLLRPRKGLEVLLRAIAKLRTDGCDVTLRAVGPFETEDYRQSVLQWTSELGIAECVAWRGFQQDIAAELQQMDLFVFPSTLPEGMPMVLLEAMAWGVPIIASQVPGVVDCLRHEREAILVKPDDVDELAAGIHRLIDGQESRSREGAPTWQELRFAARERQQAEFSIATMASRVAKIYRNVLE
ncbi:MAG: glycosyltransferase [Pirellulales bacterium]|nr:glycosyltransferase [Pirellulales bacterium]